MEKEVEVKQTETEPMTLVAKLAHATADIGPVAKDGRNKQQGYQFQSEGAIKAAVKDALSNYGVMIIPNIEVTERWSGKTAKGSTMNYATVLGRFDITDGQDHIEASMPASGMDTGDKAITKAATSAQKYLYKQLFNISDTDSESDAVDGGDYQNSNGYNQQPQNGSYHNRSRPQRRDNVQQMPTQPNERNILGQVPIVRQLIARQFGEQEADRIMYDALGAEGLSSLEELANYKDQKLTERIETGIRIKFSLAQQQRKRGVQ